MYPLSKTSGDGNGMHRATSIPNNISGAFGDRKKAILEVVAYNLPILTGCCYPGLGLSRVLPVLL